MPNHISGFPDVGHDGGQPARHRFEQRDRETLVTRRQDEHTRSRVEVGDVLPKAEELNVALNSEPPRMFLKFGEEPAGTRYGNPQLGPVGCENSNGLD